MSFVMLLAIAYVLTAHDSPIPSDQVPYGFILLALFLSTLFFIVKGGADYIRPVLIFMNIVLALSLYIPVVIYLLGHKGSIELWVPVTAVAIVIPFLINILALKGVKK